MTTNNLRATEAVSLAKLLDFGPWTMRQKAVVALAALAVVFDGLDIQLLGFAIPAIAKEWSIAKGSFASVLAAGLFGVALGSVGGGLLGIVLAARGVDPECRDLWAVDAGDGIGAFADDVAAAAFLRWVGNWRGLAECGYPDGGVHAPVPQAFGDDAHHRVHSGGRFTRRAWSHPTCCPRTAGVRCFWGGARLPWC